MNGSRMSRITSIGRSVRVIPVEDDDPAGFVAFVASPCSGSGTVMLTLSRQVR
jgi:hypothetical protein